MHDEKSKKNKKIDLEKCKDCILILEKLNDCEKKIEILKQEIDFYK